MEYTDLKNGDIVVMTYDDYFESRIIIVNKVEQSYTGIYKLYTYAELDIEYSDLFIEKDEPGFSYDVNYCTFRPAKEEEKIQLYNVLGKFFTEEYDKDWYNHFTDSSYFDNMKKRLYTKNHEHYKQWENLGESYENWYWVDNKWKIYKQK